MSAELTPHVVSSQQIAPADAAARRLGEWAQSAKAAHEIATTLVQTSFVPEQFRGQAGEATAAILAGIEVGLNPMAALRSFDIIQGVAAPRAITLRAIVQAAGHDLVLVESTATKCKIKGRRRGSAEWQEVTWTIDRAKRLGLTNKKNWTSQPEAMLLARATGECARLIASDAILGIGIAVEELDDGDPGPTRAVARGNGEKRTVARSRPATDEPALDEPASTESDSGPLEDAETGEAVTGPQMKKLQATFSDFGIVDRDERLAITRNLLEVDDLTSANELSKSQASTLIDLLEQCAGEPDPVLALRALAGIGDAAEDQP